jgi:hypothetical protein
MIDPKPCGSRINASAGCGRMLHVSCCLTQRRIPAGHVGGERMA